MTLHLDALIREAKLDGAFRMAIALAADPGLMDRLMDLRDHKDALFAEVRRIVDEL